MRDSESVVRRRTSCLRINVRGARECVDGFGVRPVRSCGVIISVVMMTLHIAEGGVGDSRGVPVWNGDCKTEFLSSNGLLISPYDLFGLVFSAVDFIRVANLHVLVSRRLQCCNFFSESLDGLVGIYQHTLTFIKAIWDI